MLLKNIIYKFELFIASSFPTLIWWLVLLFLLSSNGLNCLILFVLLTLNHIPSTLFNRSNLVEWIGSRMPLLTFFPFPRLGIDYAVANYYRNLILESSSKLEAHLKSFNLIGLWENCKLITIIIILWTCFSNKMVLFAFCSFFL